MKKSLVFMFAAFAIIGCGGGGDTPIEPGSLVSNFGNNGRVVSNSGEAAYGSVIDSNNKIVVVGRVATATNGNDILVKRYNSDGSLDTSFGSGGKVTLDYNHKDDVAYDVVIDSNNKILVAGRVSDNANENSAIVIRLNQDGSFDNSFDGNGKSIFDNGRDEVANSLVVNSTNEVFVCGYADNGTTNDFLVYKINSNGTIPGSRYLHFGGDEYCRDIKIDANNKLILAGYIMTPFSGVVVKMDQDGNTVNSFGTNGHKKVDNGKVSFLESIATDGNSYYTVGTIYQGDISAILYKYNANSGSLDNNFANLGKFNLYDARAKVSYFSDLVIYNNNIYVAGSTKVSNSKRDFLVAKFNMNGTLNQSFGNEGLVQDNIEDTQKFTSINVDKDGKLVLVGHIGTVSALTQQKIVIYKYNP